MFRIFAHNSILIERNMKKLLAIAFMLMSFFTMASAQKQAEIKFDKVTIDLGTFLFVKPFSCSQTPETPLWSLIRQWQVVVVRFLLTLRRLSCQDKKEKSRSLIMVPHCLPDISRRVLPFTVMPKLK